MPKSYRIYLISSAIWVLSAASAGAVVITNRDVGQNVINVEAGSFRQTVILNAGEMYDTQGQNAIMSIGDGPEMIAEGTDRVDIRNGRIEGARLLHPPEKKAPEASPEESPAEQKAVPPVQKTPVKPDLSKPPVGAPQPNP